jgi:hypothetical protein
MNQHVDEAAGALVVEALGRAVAAGVRGALWTPPCADFLSRDNLPDRSGDAWLVLAARPGYFLEPRRSCSRGFPFLIPCRDARRSRGVGGAAVPFARIACCREPASQTTTGGCEESAAAQASDVHGLAALDDRAADEVDGFVAGDGDAGAAGHCASVAPRGLPPSMAMVVTTSRPKADTIRDADPRDGGAKPKVGR